MKYTNLVFITAVVWIFIHVDSKQAFNKQVEKSTSFFIFLYR